MNALARLATGALFIGGTVIAGCTVDANGTSFFDGVDSGAETPDPGTRDATAHDANQAFGGGGLGDANADSAVHAADARSDANEAHDTAPPIDAHDATPSPPPPIRCGGGKFNLVECNGATETCCAMPTALGYAYACLPHGVVCLGIPIGCAHNADCQTGSVCCYRTSGASGGVACASPSECQGGGGLVLCEANAAGDCAQGQQCVPFANGVPYSLCK